MSEVPDFRYLVVPHTHWDREWYLPFEQFRLRLGAVVDGVLNTLERDLSFTTFTLDGAEVREFELRDQDLTVYATVSHGRLVLTDSERLLRDTLDGGASLADDPAFKDATEAAGVPDEVTSLAYVDVPVAVRAYYDAEGEEMPRDVRENIEPLGSAVLYGEGGDDHRTIHGFLQIG